MCVPCARKACAALDSTCFRREPLQSESPLLELPNVVLSAHNAGTTYDTFFRRADFAFRNIERIWQGRPALAVVRPES